MNKKINYILIGCGVIGIMIILAGSYILFRMNPESAVVIDPVQNTENKDTELVFTANSHSGTIESVSDEKVVIANEDGSVEEYSINENMYMYDNRVRDEMKPIEIGDLEKGMRVQISKTTSNADQSENIIITLY